MKTLKVLTIVAITGLAGSVAAHACPSNGVHGKQYQSQKEEKCQKSHHRFDKHSKKKMKEVFKSLDLTSEQKSMMIAQRKSMRQQMQAKKEEMRRERGMSNIANFVSAAGFDKQGFIQMVEKRSQMRAQMRADMFEQKINILTPEQREKLVLLLHEK